MSLLCHINTRDLLQVHADLLDDAFPHMHYQDGLDAQIEAIDPAQDPIELPVRFSSKSLALNHYLSDEDAAALARRDQIVPLQGMQTQYALPVLNVHNVGFFNIVEVISNTEALITRSRPYEQLMYALSVNKDWDYKTIAPDTGLVWSLGGYEAQISTAYYDLVTELIKRRAVTADWINSNDPMYTQALRYRALQLIYTALSIEPDDKAAQLAADYYHLYQKELVNVAPYGSEYKAVKEFRRT